MPARKGLLAPQNTFLDTIATRFDGTRKYNCIFSSVVLPYTRLFIGYQRALLVESKPSFTIEVFQI